MTTRSDSDSFNNPPETEQPAPLLGKSGSGLRQEDVRDGATYVRYAFERKGQSCTLRNIPPEGGFSGELTADVANRVDDLSRADVKGAVAAQVLFAGWQHKGKSPAWPWFKNLFRRCVRACTALDGLDAMLVDGPIQHGGIEAALQAACQLEGGAEAASHRAIRANRVATVAVWLVAVSGAPLSRVIESLSEVYWEPSSDRAVGDQEILRAVLDLAPKAGHVSSAFRALLDEARRETGAERARAAAEQEAKGELLARLQGESAELAAARQQVLALEASVRALDQEMNAGKDQFEDQLREVRATLLRAISEWLEMLGAGLGAYNKDSSREEFVAILADHARRVEVRMATHLESLRSGRN